MKYLFNSDNAARDASIDVANVRPSAAIFRADTAEKNGGGDVGLSGPYTGQTDTTVDVEIVDLLAGSNPSVSAPVFIGVGNGAMTAVTAAPGTSAQTFTITLEDLGTMTRAAYAPFQAVTLRARSAGPGGNAITVTVDASALATTATKFALSADLAAGQNEYVGDVWNFDAATLNSDGTVPDTAPRLRFGIDPQIYRAWRKYVAGQYVYGFSPAPVRPIRRGTRVYTVTGARTVKITDGVATDTLSGIVTLYDCLSAIRTNSLLVAVDGVIVNDKQPGGQGVVDLSVWTRPYVTQLERRGTSYAERAEIDIVAGINAPTEQLALACISTDGTTWDVRGDVSGALANLTVGRAYNDGDYAIVLALPADAPHAAPLARIDCEYLPLLRPMSEGEVPTQSPLAAVCFEKSVLGAKARDGQYEFVYTRRPPNPCDCKTGTLAGGPNLDCLGIDEGVSFMATESEMRRYQRLVSRVRELIGANTEPLVFVDMEDIAWIRRSSQILAKALPQITSGEPLPPEWAATHTYAIDHIVSGGNGYRYAATVAGISGATEPSWPVTLGTTVSDGAVTWENIGKTAFALWDDAYEQWSEEAQATAGVSSLHNLSGTTAPINEWTPSTLLSLSFGVNQIFIRPTFANRNGRIYTDTSGASGTSGTTGATEPLWRTADGLAFDDGTLKWSVSDIYWEANGKVVFGKEIAPDGNRIWRASTAGISGGVEPDWWSAADTASITDGTVTWVVKSEQFFENFPALEEFFDRYISLMDEAMAAAGVISSNFDGAGGAGGACWHDYDDNFWWAYNGQRVPALLPVQNGRYYHSSMLDHDADGRDIVVSTQEFGFGLRVGCPENLFEGDIIRISISGVGAGGGNGYQMGDTISAQVTRAKPLEFGGGQTGNDKLTWSVIGSVDGRLDDYQLITTALAPYTAGGIGFGIAPGGIAYALGDRYEFSVEGGHFRWRRDGGAWSATIEFGDTSLGDGLLLKFAGGAAPSWAIADKWTFDALAVNGPDHMRQPTGGQCTWLDDGNIVVQYASPLQVGAIMLANHQISPLATILIEGGDDEHTIAFTQAIDWTADTIYHDFGATLAHKWWRISTSEPAPKANGAIGWLWLGVPRSLMLPTGAIESGNVSKRWQMPTLGLGAALGVSVEHTALASASVAGFIGGLTSACADDDGRLGIVPHDDGVDASIVRYAENSLDVGEEFGFQPVAGKRLLRLKLDLAPAP